ncbi:bifunctional glutamate--cysteine ligase/glutathione synthetase [Actinobacillus equuli]|nr:bifunctional glutamate--cysteine ligase/glutathione synthetase [Actinobacillus equuli]
MEDTYRWLSAIHEVTLRSLPDDEYIFPFSMPAGLPPESEIKEAQLDNEWDVKYREHLSAIYGKYKQMVSGIHYNFQISDEFVESAFALQTEYSDKITFRNALYMKLANNFYVINGFLSICLLQHQP